MLSIAVIHRKFVITYHLPVTNEIREVTSRAVLVYSQFMRNSQSLYRNVPVENIQKLKKINKMHQKLRKITNFT